MHDWRSQITRQDWKRFEQDDLSPIMFMCAALNDRCLEKANCQTPSASLDARTGGYVAMSVEFVNGLKLLKTDGVMIQEMLLKMEVSMGYSFRPE